MHEQLTQDRPIDRPKALAPTRLCADIGETAFNSCAGCPFARQCPRVADETPSPTSTPNASASASAERTAEGYAVSSYLDELLDDTVPVVWAKKPPAAPPSLPITPTPRPKPVAASPPRQKPQPASKPQPQPQPTPQHKPPLVSVTTSSTAKQAKAVRPVSQQPIEVLRAPTQPPLPVRLATWIVDLLIMPARR